MGNCLISKKWNFAKFFARFVGVEVLPHSVFLRLWSASNFGFDRMWNFWKFLNRPGSHAPEQWNWNTGSALFRCYTI